MLLYRLMAGFICRNSLDSIYICDSTDPAAKNWPASSCTIRKPEKKTLTITHKSTSPILPLSKGVFYLHIP